jgi:hypothetical protein
MATSHHQVTWARVSIERALLVTGRAARGRARLVLTGTRERPGHAGVSVRGIDQTRGMLEAACIKPGALLAIRG